MKTTKLFFITAIAVFLFVNTGFAQKAVSIESLLNEMTNRSERAKFPEPTFTCKQFSSYDQATVAKGEPGWFANNDRSMFIRVEKENGRREFVLMDTEGPGAIVRFWMTFAGKNSGRGLMRIYIDDYSKPAIEGSAFDILSGKVVTSPPLATSVSALSPYENRGHNLYFPIPYAKACKVTYESENLYEDDPGAKRRETEAVYYNINYRTYESGTKVISYSALEMKKNQSLIAKVQKQLENKERGTEKMKLSRLALNANLRPGESQSFTIKGSNAIQQLSMEIKAANQEQALRSTVMEITFDEEKTVWSPVGDFYGIGYTPLYTSTWYTQVEKSGQMSAFWVMPFEKECVITLYNFGKQEVAVSNAFAGYNKWKWDNRSMHFGTTWQQYTRILAGAYDDAKDLNFALLKGKGVYVGDGIAIFNTTTAWWGEGDEKVFVDGEKFPSHIGTGTEDYYGYAWCRPEVFTDHPFIAQPLGTGSFNIASSVNTRYRGLDGIPFTKSIQFDLELWPWGKSKYNYAPTAFWYMIPGGQKQTENDLTGAKEPVAKSRSDIYSNRLQLFIEGENMTHRSVSKGKLEYQTQHKDIWSGGMQIYWKEIEKGDKAVFEFESDFPDTYTFTGLFTIAPDYGTFNIYLNDQLISSNLNLYNPKVDVKEIPLGNVNLRSGKNTFTVELTGYPAGFSKGCFGIDKLLFKKLD
jgi:hypothetical protein